MRMTLQLPFEARGLSGKIDVDVRPNDDPIATGHAEYALNFDEAAFRGFPLLTAKVDFPAEGPRASFAWVQWISHVRGGEVLGRGLDSSPLLNGPLYTVGYLPTFADAPANPDHANLDWVATAYLVTLDGRGDASVVLHPVTGFVWGYRRNAARTALLPLRSASPDDWAELSPLLAEEHPRWIAA